MTDEIELEFYAELQKSENGYDSVISEVFKTWPIDRKETIVEAGRKLGPTSKMRVRETVSSKGTNYFFCVKTNLKTSGPDGLYSRMEKEHEVLKETFEEFCSSISDGTTRRLRFKTKEKTVVVVFSDGLSDKIKDVVFEYDVFFDKEDKVIPYIKIDIDISHSDLLPKINSDKDCEFEFDFSSFPINEDSVFSGKDSSKKNLKEDIWKLYKGESRVQ